MWDTFYFLKSPDLWFVVRELSSAAQTTILAVSEVLANLEIILSELTSDHRGPGVVRPSKICHNRTLILAKIDDDLTCLTLFLLLVP